MHRQRIGSCSFVTQAHSSRPITIDNRCREQQKVADRMFMDFKYTSPGSTEQLQALKTLSFLLGMWGDFLGHEVKRMDAASSLTSA